jgi:quercetin dioxygenase-like cupin family protein
MRPHVQPLSGEFAELDLAAELAALHREPGWTSNGHNAKTLVKYPSLRVVLITLRERGRIPGHETDGRITIQTVSGHLRVHAAERVFDLPTGRLLALDRTVRHELEALADSAFVLTIAWPDAPAPPEAADAV